MAALIAPRAECPSILPVTHFADEIPCGSAIILSPNVNKTLQFLRVSPRVYLCMRLTHEEPGTRKKIVWLLAAFILTISALVGNMSTSGARQPRATDPSRSLQAALQMPDEVRLVMAKACNNCHTYETKWPWYSRIAPANRLIEYDVKRARAAVNFSEWSDTAGKKKGTAMGMLMAACEGSKTAACHPSSTASCIRKRP